MTPRARRLIIAAAVAVVVAIAVLGVVLVWPDTPTPAPAAATQSVSPEAKPPPGPDEVADLFLKSFRAKEFQAAGGLTDAPDAAAAKLTEVWKALGAPDIRTERVKPAQAIGGETTVETAYQVVWAIGSNPWDYTNALTLTKTGAQWKVHWAPTLIHPKLTADRTIALVSKTGQPAVLDRDGNPLLVWQGGGLKPADESVAPLLRPGMLRMAGDQGGNGVHVALLDSAGTELEALFGAPGGETKPITSTLSVPVQRAAQAAVDSVNQGAMLVAIQPSTGEILAVAQNAAAGTSPLALNGGYPAGSTFKIATATAVLEAGAARFDTVLPCPGRTTIGQRRITNDGEFDLGQVQLHTAFANSCNTTFAALAGGLGPDALSNAATQLGLNADFEIPGFITEAGRVDPAPGTTQRVEDSIGQGNVKVSPFGMALMTATVASGRAVTPKLWRGLETAVKVGYQPPPRAVLDDLRRMMREVVTAGTAKNAISGPVSGKTGTAQFGDAVHSHGWFTGYRGNLAFATLVVSGESSKAALSVSAKFLAAAS
jgi:Penicillin binding protein transpeptidase domain/NTF2-like N-terminal transpeptidase domain